VTQLCTTCGLDVAAWRVEVHGAVFCTAFCARSAPPIIESEAALALEPHAEQATHAPAVARAPVASPEEPEPASMDEPEPEVAAIPQVAPPPKLPELLQGSRGRAEAANAARARGTTLGSVTHHRRSRLRAPVRL
jgi:hypothetical protein